ncbi:MAG: hypothetical protein KDC84_06445 [Crocinitomicaceae bacterium]|nr:hypothetical protein [Crocinitomicaceae bacterium]
MKFYFSIYNRFLLTFFCLISSYILVGQGTSSPYSAFGVGLINNNSQASFASMGNVRIANSDSVLLNYSNPASYCFISTGMPIVNIGVTQRFNKYETSVDYKTKANFTFNNLSMGFRMGKRFGAAFGLLPYSRVGYSIVATEDFQGTPLINRFEGKGGLYSFFIGFAGRLLNARNHVISLGVNGKYLFGKNEAVRILEFDQSLSNYYNSNVSTSLRLRGFSGDVGLLYQARFSDAFAMNLGLTYSIGTNLKAFDDIFSYTFVYIGTDIRVESVIDTVEYVEDVEGRTRLPHILKAGLNFEFKDPDINHKNKYRILLGVDYDYEPWSNYQEVFNDVVSNDGLGDFHRLALGIQYTPHYLYYDKSPNISYFSKVNYRLGFQFAKSSIIAGGQQISQMELNAGFGFPLAIKKSSASINLGVGLGQRGTVNDNLVKESYVGIYFGLSLSPGVNNLWFRKRKYD